MRTGGSRVRMCLVHQFLFIYIYRRKGYLIWCTSPEAGKSTHRVAHAPPEVLELGFADVLLDIGVRGEYALPVCCRLSRARRC